MNLSEVNEKLIEHNCVHGFSIDIEPEALKYNLIMSLGKSEESTCKKLNIYFYDVSQLNLIDFGGGLTQFMHLKIDKDASGMDRAYFQISENEHHNVSFHFSSFDILD
jgi:hypothetical protein